MAQQPSDAVPYAFSARALIRPDVVTVLPYVAPAAPDIDRDAKITITRRFYDSSNATSSDYEDVGRPTSPHSNPRPTVAPPRSVLRGSSRPPKVTSDVVRDPSPGAPSETTSVSRESTPTPSSDYPSSRATSRQLSIGPQSEYSRTYTPPPSTPSSCATSRQPLVAPGMPSGRTVPQEPLPHLDDFVPRRGPITRSVSRGSLRFEPIASEKEAKPRKGTLRRVSALDDDDDHSQYRRETWKILQTDEEKARGKQFVTTWFYSSATYSLSAPPPCMSQHPDLQLGDLFLHCATQSSEPLIWWWIEGKDGQRFWKRVLRGQMRPDDKRRLSTATNKDGTFRPSWVSDTWFQKQEKEMKTRKKGKSKDTTS